MNKMNGKTRISVTAFPLVTHYFSSLRLFFSRRLFRWGNPPFFFLSSLCGYARSGSVQKNFFLQSTNQRQMKPTPGLLCIFHYAGQAFENFVSVARFFLVFLPSFQPNTRKRCCHPLPQI